VHVILRFAVIRLVAYYFASFYSPPFDLFHICSMMPDPCFYLWQMKVSLLVAVVTLTMMVSLATAASVLPGLVVLQNNGWAQIKGKRVGILSNPTGTSTFSLCRYHWADNSSLFRWSVQVFTQQVTYMQ
jgi:hypothetical protein